MCELGSSVACRKLEGARESAYLRQVK